MSIVMKLLGAVDILVALCFWLFGIFRLDFMAGFIMILGFILLIKGIAFATTLNWVSVIDIICSIIIIGSTSMIMPKWVIIILSLFLLQKGVFSLMG